MLRCFICLLAVLMTTILLGCGGSKPGEGYGKHAADFVVEKFLSDPDSAKFDYGEAQELDRLELPDEVWYMVKGAVTAGNKLGGRVKQEFLACFKITQGENGSWRTYNWSEKHAVTLFAPGTYRGEKLDSLVLAAKILNGWPSKNESKDAE